MEVLGCREVIGVPAEKEGACIEQDENHSTEDAAHGEEPSLGMAGGEQVC